MFDLLLILILMDSTQSVAPSIHVFSRISYLPCLFMTQRLLSSLALRFVGPLLCPNDLTYACRILLEQLRPSALAV